MTLHVEAWIECDRTTGHNRYCGTRIPDLPPYDYSPDELRHLAREAGWIETGTGHFCPEHARARKDQTA